MTNSSVLATPPESLRHTSSPRRAMSPTGFFQAKLERRKLSMVTCYDYTFARLLSESAIDGILVGDSAAMVMHGHPSTLSADRRSDAASHGGGRARRQRQIRRRRYAVSVLPEGRGRRRWTPLRR